MEKNDKNRLIALAAMFQASDLVDDLAYEGNANNEAITPLLNSLFNNESSSIEELYGGIDGLQSGIKLAIGILRNPGKGRKTMDITRYSISMLHLERALSKLPKIGEKLINDIEDIERQIQYFGDITNPTIFSRLADTYKENISDLKPQIIIKGEQIHLENTDTAAKIRALLLAGIRSAVLWRQAGGGRFTLLFKRKHLVREAEKLDRPLHVVH